MLKVYNPEDQDRLLNVGCGQSFHQDWINVDLEPYDDSVQKHDITQGLPFESGTFDGVYHSHVLEHLDLNAGERLLDECYRILKPGGVLRIVVPNLAQIAELYLDYHTKALAGERGASENYDWMKLELLDQLVRHQSGGRMGPHMAKCEVQDADFMVSRIGDEFWRCQHRSFKSRQIQITLKQRWQRYIERSRTKWARWFVKKLLGRQGLTSFDEGLFRNSGEVHRWMYDRFSLKQICEQCGFIKFRVQTATESGIADYVSYELDSCGETVRKPDSLFVECRKPMVAGELQRESKIPTQKQKVKQKRNPNPKAA